MSFGCLIVMSGGVAWSQYLLGTGQSTYMGTYPGFNTVDYDYAWYNNAANFAPMPSQESANARQYSAFANMGMISLPAQSTPSGTAFSVLGFPGGIFAGWYGSGSPTLSSLQIGSAGSGSLNVNNSDYYPQVYMANILGTQAQSQSMNPLFAGGMDVWHAGSYTVPFSRETKHDQFLTTIYETISVGGVELIDIRKPKGMVKYPAEVFSPSVPIDYTPYSQSFPLIY